MKVFRYNCVSNYSDPQLSKRLKNDTLPQINYNSGVKSNSTKNVHNYLTHSEIMIPTAYNFVFCHLKAIGLFSDNQQGPTI